MNFTELKTELFARGVDYLNEDAAGATRAESWLNLGYRVILNLQAWPFLHTVASGTAGTGTVSVPDLRKIITVTDTTDGTPPGRLLAQATIDELTADGYTDLTLTGLPDFYWVDGGTVINGFPVGGTIRARYIKRVAPMTGTDTPVFDEEYHNLIVDKAMIRAYIDSDNFDAAIALGAEVDKGLAAMTEDYLLDSMEPSYIQVVDPYDG